MSVWGHQRTWIATNYDVIGDPVLLFVHILLGLIDLLQLPHLPFLLPDLLCIDSFGSGTFLLRFRIAFEDVRIEYLRSLNSLRSIVNSLIDTDRRGHEPSSQQLKPVHASKVGHRNEQ